VAVRLSLYAVGRANVKKQASPAQIFANAVENVHEKQNSHFYNGC